MKDAGKCYEHRPAINDITSTSKRRNHVIDIKKDTIVANMAEEQTLAERIKSVRAKLGLSQAEAAKAWRLPSKRTLQHWEQGRHSPRGLYREKLEAILKKVGV